MVNPINNETELKDKTLNELNQQYHNADASIQRLEMANVILSYDDLLKPNYQNGRKSCLGCLRVV